MGYIIAHHLCGDHRQRFALGGIHFTRHDGRTGFVIRDEDLADAAAWSRRKHADVVGRGSSGSRQPFSMRHAFPMASWAASASNLFSAVFEMEAGQFGDVFGHIHDVLEGY